MYRAVVRMSLGTIVFFLGCQAELDESEACGIVPDGYVAAYIGEKCTLIPSSSGENQVGNYGSGPVTPVIAPNYSLLNSEQYNFWINEALPLVNDSHPNLKVLNKSTLVNEYFAQTAEGYSIKSRYQPNGARWAGAAGVAVADGPLPFLDAAAIAVALAWEGYDLYRHLQNNSSSTTAPMVVHPQPVTGNPTTMSQASSSQSEAESYTKSYTTMRSETGWEDIQCINPPNPGALGFRVLEPFDPYCGAAYIGVLDYRRYKFANTPMCRWKMISSTVTCYLATDKKTVIQQELAKGKMVLNPWNIYEIKY